jgi:DNA topoisomerase VI subunit B
MPPKRGKQGEVAVQVSAASFFATHQAIAGFDNPGKALFTTVRELVENSLDACEAIRQLPNLVLTVEELSDDDFARIRGLKDESARAPKRPREEEADGLEFPAEDPKEAVAAKATGYFRITCKDNGCGMPHEQVPQMLGRVLSGSKYVVRQTRGKFGLGAKMALIWSKKSTGLPIHVKTAHTASASAKEKGPPASVTECVVDIDVNKNEPRVLAHEKASNTEGWVGTELSVVIGGAWTAYKRHVLRYMQQLAIITPYAELVMCFRSARGGKGSFEYKWSRRAVAMPPPAIEVRHHPQSVNNLVVRRLVDTALAQAGVGQQSMASTADVFADSSEEYDDDSSVSDAAPSRAVPRLGAFLTRWFSSVSKATAASIIDALPAMLHLSADSPLTVLEGEHIHAITSALHEAKLPPPSGKCLSPVGEYNLRLGILKELRPEFLVTFAAHPSSYDGHPFVVEVGVALGGGAPEGLTVHRFANRIPLLFEGGSDVATLTAQRLAWGSYGIDPRSDRVAVFVSIVSTKIPFKGTGKEYIGDDIQPIRLCVKSALQRCCQQLKVKLRRRASAKERESRAKSLAKYIPSVAKSIINVLNVASGKGGTEGDILASESTVGLAARLAKRAKVLRSFAAGDITEDSVSKHLEAAIMRNDEFDAAAEAAEREAASMEALSHGASAPAAVETRLFFSGPLGTHRRSRLIPIGLASGSVFALLPEALCETAAEPLD